MPDETKPADDTAAKKPKAETKPADDTAAAKRVRQEELTELWGIGKPTGNLTRDSIIETTRARLMEKGTSEADAQKQAVKRGFEMIPE